MYVNCYIESAFIYKTKHFNIYTFLYMVKWFFSVRTNYNNFLNITVKPDVLFRATLQTFRRNVGILIGSLLWAICNQLEQLARDGCKFARVDSSWNCKFFVEYPENDFSW